MSKSISLCSSAITAMLLGSACTSLAQDLRNLGHGDPDAIKKGSHDGNLIRTTFYNEGLVGRKPSQPDDIGGEWPINSGHLYIGDVLVFVGAEFTDNNGQLKHSVVVPRGPEVGARTGERSPDRSQWWTWDPLPGFTSDSNSVAMSHRVWSWPDFWPDKLDDTIDPGWRGSWNGFFGKNQFNADQESYWYMDDYNDREFDFFPDSTDHDRRGLGLLMKCRGLQWSNVLAQDNIFWLYEVTNIGTHNYDKVVFGMIYGGLAGGSGDSNDDNADFIKEENLTFSYDSDNVGGGGWTPVGYSGYAFLESPGNPFDGIDDDGDGELGPGPTIDADLLKPRQVAIGEQVVLIDYDSFQRRVVTMPAEGVTYRFGGVEVRVMPGETLVETDRDLIDNNLNGLIDETNGTTDATSGVTTLLYEGLKYINYISGAGQTNLLIDERRDDGIDNDGDWDPLTDDVGLDGAFGTGDPGEGDGRPTSGIGTNLPGEPHIDKTDVTESDQLGLTSFYFFHPFNLFSLSDDEVLWRNMNPGFFNATSQNVDGDYIYGSGYFPMKTGITERISLAMLFGEDRDDIIRNKRTVQLIYDENYNFAKAPLLPSLTAVPGDGKVTLYWDELAELSFDAVSGFDFEGYKIYRSSDPGWKDAEPITDAFGTRQFDRPIAQFDLNNGIKGFFPVGVEGAQFFLGDDTGLRHSFVDTTVQNGFTYFYAVTAYDRGEVAREIIPSETSKFATIDKAGIITTATNVVAVVPNPRPAGYVAPEANHQLEPGPNNVGTGNVLAEILDEIEVPDNNTYQVRFYDSASDGIDNDKDWRSFSDTNQNGTWDPGEPLNDDVGADGLPSTGDPGEGDGEITIGEPNVDVNDLQEFVPLTTAYQIFNITDAAHPFALFPRPIDFFTLNPKDQADTLIDRTQDLDRGRIFFDGMRIIVQNDRSIARIPTKSIWNNTFENEPNYNYSFSPFKAAGIFTRGTEFPSDYDLVFFDGTDRSSTALTLFRSTPSGGKGAPVTIPSVPTNLAVVNPKTGQEVGYAFIDAQPPLRPSFIPAGHASAFDRVIFFENTPDTILVTWSLAFLGNDTTAHKPRSGDVLKIRTTKPFKSADVFTLRTKAAKIDNAVAGADSTLAKIKVVPNPYVATAAWEPRNPFATGRGTRELHFTHMPRHAEIRIYTVLGELVDTIEHNPSLNNGTALWDMRTKDELDIAYGVYIYHVTALDENGRKIGEKIGKFAVIK